MAIPCESTDKRQTWTSTSFEMKDVDFFFKKETVASALKWNIRYISVWKLQFLNNVICQNEGQSPKA